MHIHNSLAQRPDHVASLLIAGRIARAAGDFSTAASRFEHTAGLAPEAAEPSYLFGSTLLDLDHPAASAALRRHLSA